MKRLVAFCVGVCVVAGPSFADWEGKSGEDPMTDVPWAVAHTELGESMIPQLGFKCWKGEGLQASVMIGPVALVGSHPQRAELMLRVDKEKPVTWSGVFSESGEILMWSASDHEIPSMVDVLLHMREAKNSLGVDFGGMRYRVGLKGSRAAIQRMVETCGLTSH